MKKQEKNIHAGHRVRLFDLAVGAGVENLSDVQVMEIFLTYIFPRGDVNPLAHRLLKRFESFSNVVEAPIDELAKIEGLSQQSAKKISVFGHLFFYYTSEKTGKKLKISNKAELVDIVEDNLRLRNTENILLLALSSANVVSNKRIIDIDNSAQVGISKLELTSFLSTSKPTSLVVAHCHPFGKATPSLEDDKAFRSILEICGTCGVNLIDSYIVGIDGVFSQRDDVLVRRYMDVNDITKKICDAMKNKRA